MFELHVGARGALKEPPEKINRLMKKNISTAINDSFRPAWDMVRNPIPKGPSGLYTSIKFQRATIAHLEARIHSNHPLVDLVENPTAAHEIKPRGSVSDMVAGTARKALRFKVKGKMVFAARVHHPGTKGKRSWQAATNFLRAVLQPSVQQAIEAAIAGREYVSGAKVYAGPGVAIPMDVFD